MDRASHPGDGPQEFHLVLLDNGRTRVLADAVGRQALHCIRCSACLNVCPVYARTGGHAYGSVYPGPIGAILTPQLTGDRARRLAAVRLEPVRRLLRGLPGQDRHPVDPGPPARPAVEESRHDRRMPGPEAITMAAASWVMASGGRYQAAQRAARVGRVLGRGGRIRRLPPPLSAWTGARDAPVPPAMTFRQWWRQEHCQQQRWPGVTPRDEILARIRRANEAAAAGGGPGHPAAAPEQTGYREVGDRDQAELLDLLADRLTDYRATVRRTTAALLAGEVAAALAPARCPPGGRARRAGRVRARRDRPTAWRSSPTTGCMPLGPPAACSADGDLPGAAGRAAGVPEAGVLDTATAPSPGPRWPSRRPGPSCSTPPPGQGRRAITLVPDYHLCVVRADQVVELVPEAVERLSGAGGRPLTWISGPSATSDIELNRVEGVHGPRTLEVILVEP